MKKIIFAALIIVVTATIVVAIQPKPEPQLIHRLYYIQEGEFGTVITSWWVDEYDRFVDFKEYAPSKPLDSNEIINQYYDALAKNSE